MAGATAGFGANVEIAAVFNELHDDETVIESVRWVVGVGRSASPPNLTFE